MRSSSFKPCCFLPACVWVCLLDPAPAGVVITEIMYHPPRGAAYQYVEIHNPGAEPVGLSGWAFTSGIQFKFPDGSQLAGGAFRVICRSKETFRAAYPAVDPAILLGDFSGELGNEGEEIALSDDKASVVERVIYDDDSPWDFLADGFGASLERVCFSEGAGSFSNWRASRVPADPEEFGGSPGEPGRVEECPPQTPVKPRVFISEIMYHPVLEEALEDFHEFVEIHNAEAQPISLEGWRLSGGVEFTFPAGSSIAAGQYLVIAKDKAQLAAVAAYGLGVEGILGNYGGDLDNGGDKVALIGAGGQGIDSATYDDDAPWPAGADALGAGASWLRPELLPLTKHRYLGHSLERVSFEWPAGEISNWAPSPLDGPTPGRPNASAREVPLPIVAELEVAPAAGGGPLIGESEEVLLTAWFSPVKPQGPVEVEYYLDDVIKGTKPVPVTLEMFDDGASGGDLRAGDRIYSAILPGQAAGSIVRYRIHADRGSGKEPVAPRPTDPNQWNAYFVSPKLTTDTPVYHVFVSQANWGRMWTNIQSGRASGCSESATWDAEVPAVLVHEGRVHDVQTRYQGSRWNRAGGPTISSWPYPRPSTGPLLGLSWRFSFPRYNQLGGRGELNLNKLTQGCPGYNAAVGYRLFEMADVPGSRTRFVRLHVNGGYYRYMLEIERPGEEMMERYHGEMAQKHPELPREKVGHLFKSVGCNCDEGPYGWGDERLLNPICGFTKEQRYAATYPRKTHDWDDYSEFIALIEELHAARKAGKDALRAYFEERFDLDLLLSYMAIINWSVPFDDMFQNHFLYQRLGDGKWLLFAWDLDQNFGEWKPASASLYMGELGDPDNRSGWWNYLKDAFLESYRAEFEDRLLLLNNTVLHPDNVARVVDEVTAEADPQEAAQAASGFSCSFPGRATSFKAFAVQRHALVNTKLAGVKLEAGPDQTVFAGTPVQFDASASTPDPGPDVPYSWDNGMEGETPTFVFNEPGEHVVTLTVRLRGVDFTDFVTITVLPRPDVAFRETGGQVVMEAESFSMNERHGAENTWWELATAQADYSGAGYMEAKEARRQTYTAKYAATAPELRYAVAFENAGDYRVWIRGFSTATAADSCYVGLEGQERATKYATQFPVDPAAYQWSGDTPRDGPQVLQVKTAGLHLLSIWIRESKQIIDKVILTKDMGFVPAGAGPPESERAPVEDEREFLRGDANRDGSVNMTDPIAVLAYLFQGGTLDCLDAGDGDDNGELSITDPIVLLNHLFLGGPPPPAPYPEPGKDSTADELDCRP